MMEIEINNNRRIIITQPERFGKLEVKTLDSKGQPESIKYIPAGDTVMLWNYWNYQKEHSKEIF